MEIVNRLQEDARYLYEMNFGHARETVHFKGSNGPVIGIGGFAGGFLDDSLKRYMRENNVQGVLSIYGSFNKGLETYFDNIEKDVKKYSNATIIAYSAAGISTLLWANRFNRWNQFKKIITVGTPFNGVKTPPFLKFIGQTLTDLQPKSRLIKEVNSIMPPEKKVLSLFAKFDEHIKQPRDLNLNWESAILGPTSHGELQNHGDVLENILDSELGIYTLKMVK